MECRVGITQTPDEALSHWEEKHPTLRSWEILGEFSSQSAAQFVSKLHAGERRCAVHLEDSDSEEGPWFVYSFGFGEVTLEIELRDAEGKVCSVESLHQFKEFLIDEMKFWSGQRDKVSKSTHTMHRYLECPERLGRHIRVIDRFIHDSSIAGDDDFAQQSERLAASICSTISEHWIWSGRSYISTYVMCHLKHGRDAANAFLNYVLEEAISVRDKAEFFGVMQGYEFTYHDGSTISRHDDESQSFDRLREQFQSRIVRFQIRGNKCTDDFMAWGAKVRKETDMLHEKVKNESNSQAYQQFKRIKQIIKKWEERMNNLENLYEEKLRLKKPAKYWKSAAKKYRRQGIGWLLLVGSISAIGLGWLAGTFDDWLHGADVELDVRTLQGAVIFASLMAVFAFVVRMLSRLVFSSFHLMRDAQEREQLTYLYLALSEKEPAVKESRDIVLRALFSRSQTGLLTDEHGPTMLAADVVRSDNK